MQSWMRIRVVRRTWGLGSIDRDDCITTCDHRKRKVNDVNRLITMCLKGCVDGGWLTRDVWSEP